VFYQFLCRAQNSLEQKDVTPAYTTTPQLIITAAFEEKFQSDCHLNFLCEYKFFKEVHKFKFCYLLILLCSKPLYSFYEHNDVFNDEQN